ncbi:LamB/YcsF family protein [Fuchsiella alkaliacetigena]|uniref:LamB/YcsF family protein n=1 Tax=Fuchsiella alkaliacetigena TaxID=957042 RepID=UPI002009F5AB|nr:5-oxoprolinase subunit PxpA [Fuchsiella alkaliacetigena]MCK8824061.1 LamB/YcsF family protein [Fuchsiella alkaliacetigena]
MSKVDLNSDLGESFGNYILGLDKEIMAYITSANIACGAHAGDPLVMQKTVQQAVENGVAVGAHPGFFDLMGFGRRVIEVTAQEVKSYVKYQLGALQAFAKGAGSKVEHVKPHGALYNMATDNPEIAMAIAEGIFEVDREIILVGLANSELITAGQKQGLQVANEVFADRAYNEDGTLVPREEDGAVIHDSEVAIARVVKMIKEAKVEAITGEEIAIQADTVCVHGDNPQAVEFVEEIRAALLAEGVEIAPLREIKDN